MTVRKILYVTGTRADFGLMAHVLQRIHSDSRLTLQVAVTGMHLSTAYGLTVTEIEALDLPIVARIATAVDDRTPAAMAQGIGTALVVLTDVLQQARPDLLLVIGDRGEMLAGAIAALHLGVPIVHLHGGERSGTVDEPVRHAITKLSHWHFVATEESKDRVIRMGERPEHVWVTGAPSLDGLSDVLHAPRARTLTGLGLSPNARYALVLFHPVVQEMNDAYVQTQSLLLALKSVREAHALEVIWLAPNADAGSGGIIQALNEAPPDLGLHCITHLQRDDYLAVLRHAEVLVGNSSSGIIEAASLGTPVVNIGDRQHCRERNLNTVDCGVSCAEVEDALRQCLGRMRHEPANRYGDGQAAGRIVELLATLPICADLLNKVNAY
jgi:GDP/UDP-N,N'-diacetylbacillosamine 2-epimerase (hydrolysing)